MRDRWGDPSTLELWGPTVADDPVQREWWSQMMRWGAGPGAARTLMEMYRNLDVRPLLPLVPIPALILWREGDRILPPRFSRTVADGIPDCRGRELEGEDHIPWFGDAGAVLDEIEEFLTGRPASAPVRASSRPCSSPISSTRPAGGRARRPGVARPARRLRPALAARSSISTGSVHKEHRRRSAGDLRRTGAGGPGGARPAREHALARPRDPVGHPHGRVRADRRRHRRDRGPHRRARRIGRTAGRGDDDGHGQGPRDRLRARVLRARHPRAQGRSRSVAAVRRGRRRRALSAQRHSAPTQSLSCSARFASFASRSAYFGLPARFSSSNGSFLRS